MHIPLVGPIALQPPAEPRARKTRRVPTYQGLRQDEVEISDAGRAKAEGDNRDGGDDPQ